MRRSAHVESTRDWLDGRRNGGLEILQADFAASSTDAHTRPVGPWGRAAPLLRQLPGSPPRANPCHGYAGVERPATLCPAIRGKPVPEDMRTMVVHLAHLPGFVPSKRRRLPGDEHQRKARKVFKPMVRWEENRRKLLQEQETGSVE